VKVVAGNKTYDINEKELNKLIKCYDGTVIDLGTGDGRFVYQSALKKPNLFYIGIDPSQKQLEIYSKKVVRKKLPNVIFCLGSLEHLPLELKNKADRLVVNLPWGTLLQNIVLPSREPIQNLVGMMKRGGILDITLGYHQELEPSETARLNLPDLSEEYIKNVLVPKLEEYNLTQKKIQKMGRKKLRNMMTTWSKKLSFGKMRQTYRLSMTKH
jgi:16S rRNA (adenine(1408)-N(1))-methyltransferase